MLRLASKAGQRFQKEGNLRLRTLPDFLASDFTSGSFPHDEEKSALAQTPRAEEPQVEQQPKKAELMAAFTCNKCGERTGIAFSKVAYEGGVVIARCSKCEVQHLVADQLGWFGEKGNIEDILREKGQEVRRVGAGGVLALSPEELASWSKS